MALYSGFVDDLDLKLHLALYLAFDMVLLLNLDPDVEPGMEGHPNLKLCLDLHLRLHLGLAWDLELHLGFLIDLDVELNWDRVFCLHLAAYLDLDLDLHLDFDSDRVLDFGR